MEQICELNDRIVLGTEGLSAKAPRITARAIVRNQNGSYAVMYADKWKLHSLPGGGVEDGEDVRTALRREVYEETERTSWREYYESVKDLPDDVQRWKFEIEWNGRHIGWVSSYPIDENYEWLDEVKDGQTVHRAAGIDICESDVWGQGIGTNALRAFMKYYFENGADALYTQTWSGNTRMIRCAEKLGFVECNPYVGIREI